MAKLFVGHAHGDDLGGMLGSFTGYSEFHGSPLYWGEEATGGARYIQQAGTFSRFSFYITENDLTGSTTIKDRKNAAYGSISITVPANRTGIFYTVDDTVSVAVADTYGFEVVSGAGTGTINMTAAAIFTPTSGLGETMLHSGGPYTRRSFNETAYYTSGTVGSLTETTIQTYSGFTATHSKLTALVLNNSLTGGASTVTSRKNTAAGNMSCTVPLDTTGQFRDNTNTDSLSPGDYWAYKLTTGSGSGGEIFDLAIDSQMALSTGRSLCIHTSNLSRSFGTTYYYPPIGRADSTASTETYTHLVTNFPYKVSNVYVKAFTNSTNGTSTYTSRIGSDNNFKSDGNISITIGAAATGWFSDVSHFDIVRPQQFYNFKISVGGTSGTLQLVHKVCEIEVLDDESSGLTVYSPEIRVRNS